MTLTIKNVAYILLSMGIFLVIFDFGVFLTNRAYERFDKGGEDILGYVFSGLIGYAVSFTLASVLAKKIYKQLTGQRISILYFLVALLVQAIIGTLLVSVSK